MLEVNPDTLASAAGRVDEAAAALKDIDVVTPFTSSSDALPGSQVAQACLWVSTRTGAAVQVYGGRLSTLAAAAAGTASMVTGVDGDVGAQFQRGVPR